MSEPSISVVVPAYNRPRELTELLDSVLTQVVTPQQVLVREDKSPQRDEIRAICLEYGRRLAGRGIELTYAENETNIGYDKNLRKCIESASSDWAFVLGNDDLLLPNAVRDLVSFVRHHDVDFVSRAFIRFNTDVDRPIGVSSISARDAIFNKENAPPRMIFRAAGFVGGLAIRTDFARKHTSREFDGSLYYQIYLASIAYCENGIGYVSTPIVGGRADNPPMFGGADDDRDVHVPGSYTAKGRARMWKGVLDIARHVGERSGYNLLDDLKRELAVRQSFHVFEMNVASSRTELRNLRDALSELDLYSHAFPKFLYTLNYITGRCAIVFYWLFRKLIQR